MEHDRQDHAETGCVRGEDPAGGRRGGTRTSHHFQKYIHRAVCQRGGDGVPGDRGRFPERAPRSGGGRDPVHRQGYRR